MQTEAFPLATREIGVEELMKAIGERFKRIEGLMREREEIQRRCDEAQRKYDQRREEELANKRRQSKLQTCERDHSEDEETRRGEDA